VQFCKSCGTVYTVFILRASHTGSVGAVSQYQNFPEKTHHSRIKVRSMSMHSFIIESCFAVAFEVCHFEQPYAPVIKVLTTVFQKHECLCEL